MENIDKKLLLNIVYDTISDHLNNTSKVNKSDLLKKYPILQNNAATFVTLNLNGNLRGCIGSLIAHRTLLDDITSNAFNAAFKDPRFQPLSKQEFNDIEIEISLLSTPVQVNYSNFEELKEIIKPGVDGVIIKQGAKQATFLPQVWDQLPNFEDFFNHLFHKANIPDITNSIDVYLYQVEKIV